MQEILPANEIFIFTMIDIGLINSSHENEEDEEDVEDEVHRSEEGVGVFDGGKVEVAEDEAELGEAGVRDGVKVLDLGAEHEEGELREGHEDDAEHDGEGPDVRRAALQRPGELRHGLVEGDVLEDLDDAEEHRDRRHLLERLRRHREVREVGKLLGLGEERLD